MLIEVVWVCICQGEMGKLSGDHAGLLAIAQNRQAKYATNAVAYLQGAGLIISVMRTVRPGLHQPYSIHFDRCILLETAPGGPLYFADALWYCP